MARDHKRVNEQENKDYVYTVNLLTDLFNNYETTFTQMPEFHPTDVRLKVVGHQPHKYNIEVKTRNQDMDKYHTIPLKEAKLNGMINDTKEDEKLLYIVFVNDYQYFIFDIDNIDFNKVEKRNWRIKKQEYNIGKDEYITVPTYFIPIELSVNNGLIKK